MFEVFWYVIWNKDLLCLSQTGSNSFLVNFFSGILTSESSVNNFSLLTACFPFSFRKKKSLILSRVPVLVPGRDTAPSLRPVFSPSTRPNVNMSSNLHWLTCCVDFLITDTHTHWKPFKVMVYSSSVHESRGFTCSCSGTTCQSWESDVCSSPEAVSLISSQTSDRSSGKKKQKPVQTSTSYFNDVTVRPAAHSWTTDMNKIGLSGLILGQNHMWAKNAWVFVLYVATVFTEPMWPIPGPELFVLRGYLPRLQPKVSRSHKTSSCRLNDLFVFMIYIIWRLQITDFAQFPLPSPALMLFLFSPLSCSFELLVCAA